MSSVLLEVLELGEMLLLFAEGVVDIILLFKIGVFGVPSVGGGGLIGMGPLMSSLETNAFLDKVPPPALDTVPPL